MKPSRFRISAIANFILDFGIATVMWRAIHALRIRVNISPIGSLTTVTALLLDDQLQLGIGCQNMQPQNVLLTGCYQLDLVTPGISPFSAFSRKQMRHIPKRRM